jgi:predicted PurR-regulated permease PerM
LRQAADVVVPLLLGLLFSYALAPVVSGLARLRLPRPVGAAAVLLAVVGMLAFGVFTLSDDVIAIVEDIPAAARKLNQTVHAYRQNGDNTLERLEQAATDIERSAAEAAGPPPPPPGVQRVEIHEKPIDIWSHLWTGSMSVAGLLNQGLLLLFLVYFMLSSGDLFRRKLVQIAGPSLVRRRVTVEVLDEISGQIQRFLFAQLLTAAAVGVASWLAFAWLGLRSAPAWGVAAAVFNTVPYFGPVVVAAAVAVAGLLQFGNVAMAAGLAAVSLSITAVEGFLMTPWVIGRMSLVNAVATFVALLVGSWMWGVVGLLVAVPTLLVVKAICDRVDGLRGVGVLLGD